MKIKALTISLLSIVSIAGFTSCSGNNVPEVVFNELEPIEASKTLLHAKETIKLSCASENITWSVNNDLATIDQEGNLTVGEKDGQFLVTVTSKDNAEFKANKLFTVKTHSSEELAEMIYDSALGQNYTITWTGKFFNEDGTEVTKEQVKKDEPNPEVLYVYEDMTTKGNKIKFTDEAFYWLYGLDGYGNEYEGGSYNSPDGYVYDYSVSNSKAIKGNPDYFSAMLGIPKYQDIYTGDLRYFVKDEFKIEDANLELSSDCSYLEYDAKKDQNDFRTESTVNDDFSLSSTIFGIVDSSYSIQFVEFGFDLEATGKVTYDDKSVTMKFLYKDVSISENATYDYEATFAITDIGTTSIPGIKDLIKADLEALS